MKTPLLRKTLVRFRIPVCNNFENRDNSHGINITLISTTTIYVGQKVYKCLIEKRSILWRDDDIVLSHSRGCGVTVKTRAGGRRLGVKVNVGALEREDVYYSFFDESTRRLIQVTPEYSDYAMGLVENIDNRKQLLFDKGILTNPYNFTDL